MISGLFFGLAFGTAGIAAALLGQLADHTSIGFVYRAVSFMPLLGLLTISSPTSKAPCAAQNNSVSNSPQFIHFPLCLSLYSHHPRAYSNSQYSLRRLIVVV